jgi:hypothetical protein
MIPLMQQQNRRLYQNKDDDKNYHKQRGMVSYRKRSLCCRLTTAIPPKLGSTYVSGVCLVPSFARQEPFAE